MVIEGIVISKTLYKEKDIIAHLLLRSGETMAIYFYGGKGGGKKHKGSIIEIGFSLKVVLQPQKKKLETQIFVAKEYSLQWYPKLIRENYQAYCLASFYAEMIGKITSDVNYEDLDLANNEGIYKVLSNALFYLDNSLEQKQFQIHQHLFLFLTKIIIELGINPDTSNCLYCHGEFSPQDLCLFEFSDGGFSCLECASQKDEFLSENKKLLSDHQQAQALRLFLAKVYGTKYKDYNQLSEITQSLTVTVFNYINFQFGLKLHNYKTWNSLSH